MIELLIACPGVGHTVRGFETYAQECHEALRGRPELRVRLAGGRGRVPGAESRALARLGGAVRRDGYFAQQLLFAATLLPGLAARPPDVVLVSDWVLASALGRGRALTRGRFKLLLANGAPGGPRFDRTIDHVQQLTPGMHQVALDGGEPPERHTLLPHGLAIPERFEPTPAEERRALRGRLGLPAEAEIVLSVAALNTSHKRLDVLIEAVAALEPRPHLVLLGERGAESAAVLRLAHERLGPAGHTVRTVPREQVAAYYRAADMLAHAAVHEAFGLALAEALSHGLPVLAHASPTSRFVLGRHGLLGDLTTPAGLAPLVRAARERPGGAEERHRFAYERFSWDRLAPAYVEMVRRVAAA